MTYKIGNVGRTYSVRAAAAFSHPPLMPVFFSMTEFSLFFYSASNHGTRRQFATQHVALDV